VTSRRTHCPPEDLLDDWGQLRVPVVFPPDRDKPAAGKRFLTMLDQLRSAQITSGGQKFGQKFRPPATWPTLRPADRDLQLSHFRQVFTRARETRSCRT